MRHLVVYLPLAEPDLKGEPKKFNRASTLTSPRQTLNLTAPNPCLTGKRPESVDAAGRRLYKTANGGGRNPAADVL
jgi:hypothetical protein